VEAEISIADNYAGLLGIAPFILMTFVENAFKHVSANTDSANWINLSIALDKQQLSLFVANSTSAYESTEVVKYGGIGLANVKRRLDLLYPEAYELTVTNQQNVFEVRLNLSLAALQASPIMQMA
jgi:two-component system LytT family sensor kinase